MKINPVVKKETGILALGEGIFCVVMLLIYLLCRRLTLNVLTAALISGGLSVLNFFLMGLTVQRAVTIEDDKQKVRLIRSSQMLRLLLIAVIIILCLAFPKLDMLALFIPLFFPRIIMFVRGIRDSIKGGSEGTVTQPEEERHEE